MNTDNLWDKLEPKNNRDGIKRDLEAGLVPNLPFFIVDALEAKTKINNSISHIDNSFQYGFLTADYGNGKTNIMKYLKYFFETHPERHVKVELWSADVDRYNMINFLLHIINSNCMKELRIGFELLVTKEEKEVKALGANFDGPASFLKKYYDKIKASLTSETDSDEFDILIALGTGRVHYKNYFDKRKLEQIGDSERHYVLLFFLNVISYGGTYIIFAIDELEKVLEKSRARFNLMLTSYRELIDLANQIKAHYLITTGTDAMGNSANMNLEDYNPAFARRIKNFKIELSCIDKQDDILNLVNYLNEFINKGNLLPKFEVNKIVDAVLSKSSSITRNSELIQFVCARLINNSKISWKDVLSEDSLTKVFDKELTQLKNNQNISRIDYALMNSIEDLLAVKGLLPDIKVHAQNQQIIVDDNKRKIQLFLTTDDSDAAISKVQYVIKMYPDYYIVIYRKISTDIQQDDNMEIITYEPLELMALIDMLTDNKYVGSRKSVEKVISAYTNNNL